MLTVTVDADGETAHAWLELTISRALPVAALQGLLQKTGVSERSHKEVRSPLSACARDEGPCKFIAGSGQSYCQRSICVLIDGSSAWHGLHKLATVLNQCTSSHYNGSTWLERTESG